MGLIDSVNNINYTLKEKKETETKKELERKAKEKERLKAKEEKELRERIKEEITIYLEEDFKDFLQKNGSSNVYYFYNPKLKEEILQKIFKNYIVTEYQKMPKGYVREYSYIKDKDFITKFYNNNYFKILKKAEEEQKKNEQYIYYNAILTQNKEKEEQQQQQEQVQYTQAKKQYNYNTIYTILKIIFYIICAPIAILVLILISACKNQK